MDFSLTNLFSPINDNDYCLWFYYLSVFGFIFLVILLLSALANLFFNKKKTKSGYYFALFIVMLSYGVFYFQNRLLYSMCVKSI